MARAEDGAEFFEKKIRPVLAENCYECHGPKKQKGGLRLDSASAIDKGGDTGALFVPKKPEESLLITALRYHDKDLQMPPPKDGVDRKLPDSQINDFVAWINSGAALPSAKTSASLKVRIGHFSRWLMSHRHRSGRTGAGRGRRIHRRETREAQDCNPRRPADKRTLDSPRDL